MKIQGEKIVTDMVGSVVNASVALPGCVERVRAFVRSVYLVDNRPIYTIQVVCILDGDNEDFKRTGELRASGMLRNIAQSNIERVVMV